MSDTPTFDSTITTAKHADDTSTHIDADRVSELLARRVPTVDDILGHEPAPVRGDDDTTVLPAVRGEDA